MQFFVNSQCYFSFGMINSSLGELGCLIRIISSLRISVHGLAYRPHHVWGSSTRYNPYPTPNSQVYWFLEYVLWNCHIVFAPFMVYKVIMPYKNIYESDQINSTVHSYHRQCTEINVLCWCVKKDLLNFGNNRGRSSFISDTIRTVNFKSLITIFYLVCATDHVFVLY